VQQCTGESEENGQSAVTTAALRAAALGRRLADLEWPRGQLANQDELDAAVDEMFTDETLAVTNAVVVVRGGEVVSERYGGEQFHFDRPAEPITRDSQLLSWSMPSRSCT